MTKFNIGDKVEFIQNYGSYEIGDVVEVTGIWGNKKGVFFKGNKGNGNAYAQRLKLFTPKKSKNQRITVLENELAELLPLKEEVAELKLIVHELRDKKVVPSTDEQDIIEFEGDKYRKVDREASEGDVVVFREAESNVISDDVYELIVEDNPFDWVDEPLDEDETPNQQRAQIIEDAKKFVEDCKDFTGLITRRKGYKAGKFTKVCDAEFVVKPEKRTVICILKEQIYETIEAKGIAKCNPSDVFNKHIGMAIALGRALELDVSKFEQAVQPNKPVIGMKFIDRHGDVREIVGEGIYDKESMKSAIDSPNVEDYPIQIINDTNAQYGGVE